MIKTQRQISAAEALKKGMRHWATGVVLLTTLDQGQKPCGIIINSLASVSLDPALVLFTLDNKAFVHKDFAIPDQEFVINILSDRQDHIAHNFTRKPFDKRWNNVSLLNDGLSVEGSLCHMTCQVFNLIDQGDHTIVLGRVVSVVTDDNKKPLLYYNRDYRLLTS